MKSNAGKRQRPRAYLFVLSDLGVLWATQCPQWRFGQLMENVMRYIRNNGDDPFYLEETTFREYMEKYLRVNDEI